MIEDGLENLAKGPPLSITGTQRQRQKQRQNKAKWWGQRRLKVLVVPSNGGEWWQGGQGGSSRG